MSHRRAASAGAALQACPGASVIKIVREKHLKYW
jgi:hypothetical protein